MGAFLDKPKTEKITDKGEGCGIRYGVSAMQGWRMEMEDAHVCKNNFGFKDWGFFGVFDGHAGSKVSQYCAEHLLSCIIDSTKTEPGKEPSADAITEGIKTGFLKLDAELRSIPQWANGEDRSGTTAIVVMVSPDKIIWANCGDSRGLLCRNEKVEFATADHKPYNQGEKDRIERAGGTVMMQRVNGSLAVSRALGDFDYKRAAELKPIEQLVSPEPEITVIDRHHADDEFLLLACDGIFDVMSNEEVISYVKHHLELTDDLAQICSDLIDTCLNKNSRDNMSVVLVTFPNAPKVSQEAIEKEEKLQEKAKKEIDMRVREMVKGASDPLEVDENSVLQQLAVELPDYDVFSKRPFLSELLQTLIKEKFGNLENSEGTDFVGPHDPSEAPSAFQYGMEGKQYYVMPAESGSSVSSSSSHEEPDNSKPELQKPEAMDQSGSIQAQDSSVAPEGQQVTT